MTTEKDVRDRLQQQGIIPNAEAIAKIWQGGGIASLVFEAKDEEAALSIGWNGTDPVFEITPEAAARFAKALQRLSPGDVAAVRWLTATAAERPYRLFVFIHEGTLLFNHVAGKGFMIEPGTRDHEWKS